MKKAVKSLIGLLRLSWKITTTPRHGRCGVCGMQVRHHYPWYTGNPKRGGRPLHDRCARDFLFDEGGP